MKSKEEKSVLISIQPKWVEKIASGEKTIEVRKSRPKLETSFKCYIYETQGEYKTGTGIFAYGIELKGTKKGKGKVIGEFVCDRIDSYVGRDDNKDYWDLSVDEWEELKKKSCLTIPQILEYTGDCCRCYGWHISDLKIYDKPRALREFRKACPYTDGSYCLEQKCEHYDDYSGKCCCVVERPPQSWCYVEE